MPEMFQEQGRNDDDMRRRIERFVQPIWCIYIFYDPPHHFILKRCKFLENHIKKNAQHKHLILVINKVIFMTWGEQHRGIT